MTPRLYEDSRMRSVTGNTLRPGGFIPTDQAMAWCNLPADAKILDLGCGIGATVEHLRKAYGIRAFGTDRSGDFLAEAKARDPHLSVFQALAQALPCGNETLDAVICECVLSLINPVQEALKELHRILAPGGWLIITDIYLRHMGIQNPGTRHPECCLDGAVSEKETKQRIQDAGFDILLWQDHSRYLKELAAKLVLEYGSLAHFRCDAAICGKPGYYLMIAKKENNNDGG